MKILFETFVDSHINISCVHIIFKNSKNLLKKKK